MEIDVNINGTIIKSVEFIINSIKFAMLVRVAKNTKTKKEANVLLPDLIAWEKKSFRTKLTVTLTVQTEKVSIVQKRNDDKSLLNNKKDKIMINYYYWCSSNAHNWLVFQRFL